MDNKEMWEMFAEVMNKVFSENNKRKSPEERMTETTNELTQILEEMAPYAIYSPMEVIRYFEKQVKEGRELLDKLKNMAEEDM